MNLNHTYYPTRNKSSTSGIKMFLLRLSKSKGKREREGLIFLWLWRNIISNNQPGYETLKGELSHNFEMPVTLYP